MTIGRVRQISTWEKTTKPPPAKAELQDYGSTLRSQNMIKIILTEDSNLQKVSNSYIFKSKLMQQLESCKDTHNSYIFEWVEAPTDL